MLGDLLVVGVADDHICRCILAEKRLNFDQARQIALVMESADKNVHNIAACFNTTVPTQPNMSCVNRGNSHQGKNRKPCFRCDSKHSLLLLQGSNLQFLPENWPHFSNLPEKERHQKLPDTESTEMSLMATPPIISGDTTSVYKLFHISQKKKN